MSAPSSNSAAFPCAAGQHDPIVDDAVARDQRLADDSTRLFTPRDSLSVDVLDVFRNEPTTGVITHTDREAFQDCLRRQYTVRRDSRFYILKPSKPRVVSRCPLHISEEMTRKMLATHNVMPSFLDHLHAFGRRESREQDASFGGGKYKLGFSPRKSPNPVSSYELCYTLKFAVNNGRKAEDDPFLWSIRQTSVYQKFEYDDQQSVWIVVQPSESTQRRLVSAADANKVEEEEEGCSLSQNPLKMHLLFISAAAEGLRDYYNHLEKIFFEMTKAAVNFEVERSLEKHNQNTIVKSENQHDPLGQFEVNFQSVQDLQQFEELLRRVKTALEINEDSIRSLMALNDKLRQLSSDADKSLWIQVDVEAEQQLAVFGRHKRNIEALLQNVHGRASLLYNVLDFKNALTVSHQGQRAMDIKQLQRSESTMMMMLNEITVKDAVGVKILTILATLYLPASFVAILFRLFLAPTW